ncbi:MAG: hypothetical protein WC775_04970 [Patescibacteria group bacterium]
MEKKSKFFIFLIGIAGSLGGIYTAKFPITQHRSPEARQVLAEVDVSASVGYAPVAYTLFGYTSSLALVKLEGVGVSEETHARSDGYFEFTNFYAPRNSNEFCLTPIDTDQLVGTPLCIVAPVDVQGKRFGPYLLSPTISVATGNPQTGQSDAVSGKTIPGTLVTINTFDDPDRQTLALVPHAYAARSKKITATSNADGSFSTQITAEQSGKIRVFAQSVFESQKTPKSNTLTLTIFSAWFTAFMLMLGLLRNLINWNIIILLQVSVLLFILYKRIHMHHVYRHKQRALLLRRQNLPMIEPERELVKINRT